MTLKFLKNTVLLFVLLGISCGSEGKKQSTTTVSAKTEVQNEIIVGANRTEMYLPLLKDKRIGIVANQTSVIFNPDHSFTHVVDSLKSLGVSISKVFAPEHGFRGKADAGEIVKDGVDTKTGLPIVSLYGKQKKPSAEHLKDIDVVIFDIQDVGARFYTYISSLHYVMEACAEQNVPMIIFDRPNPNGHYIDGPILESDHQSFVGMHPVPIVHGMTIGEYTQMINGEGWLTDGIRCDITVIPVAHYDHESSYSLPIKPSPNLPSDKAINLYPSLCFFEGTNVSAGRGTDTQFQIFGSPFLNKDKYTFEFTPQPNDGAKYPKHKGEICYGLNLKQEKELSTLNLKWLLDAYQNTEDQKKFFNNFFVKLAGTTSLQEQIQQGWNESQIKASWQEGLSTFKAKRSNYLIYN